MKLSECFEGVSALGVETAPFIYFVEQHVTYGPLVNTLFGRAQDRQIQIITSVITLL